MGTRFLASQEANAHPVYKEQVLQAAETATTYSSLFDDGWPDAPHRTLHNSTLANWQAKGLLPEESVRVREKWLRPGLMDPLPDATVHRYHSRG